MRKEREDGRLTRTSRAEETVGTCGARRSEAEGSLHWTRRTHARSMFAVIFGRYSERRRRGAGEDHDATQRPLELGEIKPLDQILHPSNLVCREILLASK